MKINKNHYAAKPAGSTDNIRNIEGQPETAFDMVNKYGTYEIQPTSDSGNKFPEISQGLPKENRPKRQEK